MIFSLFRKNKTDRDAIHRQYRILTDAGRWPEFYSKAHAPDTVLGRYEMLSALMILYFRRTSTASQPVKDLAQEIADAFFEDLDHSIRELGIGDHGVPKRLKKLTQMFYGRLESYGAALDAGDAAALEAALKRNMHPESTDPALSMRMLADYMVLADQRLKDMSEERLLRGEAEFLPMTTGGAQ